MYGIFVEREEAYVMIRAAIILSLSGILLAGCEKTNDDDLSQEQLKRMSRYASAPDASSTFLDGFSRVECRATIKNTCSPEGCDEGNDIKITQIYDVKEAIYRRADSKGSDEYPATIVPSGIWYNVGIPRGGMLFRFNTLGDFTEVVTLNDTTILYSGSCQFK